MAKQYVMILNNPFFWALISMFALVGANAVASKKFVKKLPYGITMVVLFASGRLMLVLPFCPQPRFASGGLHQIIGSIVAILGIIFCSAAFGIKPFTAPGKATILRTTGFYKITRNPIYLGEILWSLGWAIIFRSTIGIALTPVWWIALLIITFVEEECLTRKLGDKYLEYMKTVKGRIVPGLPI